METSIANRSRCATSRPSCRSAAAGNVGYPERRPSAAESVRWCWFRKSLVRGCIAPTSARTTLVGIVFRTIAELMAANRHLLDSRGIDALEAPRRSWRPHDPAMHHAVGRKSRTKASPPVTLAGISTRGMRRLRNLYWAGSFSTDCGDACTCSISLATRSP